MAEFKTECLCSVHHLDISGFPVMAALLPFAKPAESNDCRKWFVQCSVILDEFSKSKSKELVDIVRFLWRSKMLNPSMLRDFTLNAIHRLKEEHGMALCQFLVRDHASDDLVKKTLSLFPGAKEAPPSTGYRPTDKIILESWYVPGDLEQCRLCGYRPPKKSAFWEKMHWISRSVLRFTRRCGICNFLAMKRGLYEHPIAEEPRGEQPQDETRTRLTRSATV